VVDRRAFIGTLVGGVLAAPLAAIAQQAGKINRIGFINAGPAASNASNVEAFRAGLRDLGYADWGLDELCDEFDRHVSPRGDLCG
jgi:putative tryptophan/tyrosine transport system substrate-binding protein